MEIDKEALRLKYRAERDKRIRPDGNDQYVRLADEFAHFRDDPHAPWTERAPLTDHRTVVCVGGGFAGLVAAARHMPTEKYVHGPEILAHCQRIGKRFGLYEAVLFHAEVTGLGWDGDRWVISNVPHNITDSARTIAAVVRSAGTFDGLEFR